MNKGERQCGPESAMNQPNADLINDHIVHPLSVLTVHFCCAGSLSHWTARRAGWHRKLPAGTRRQVHNILPPQLWQVRLLQSQAGKQRTTKPFSLMFLFCSRRLFLMTCVIDPPSLSVCPAPFFSVSPPWMILRLAAGASPPGMGRGFRDQMTCPRTHSAIRNLHTESMDMEIQTVCVQTHKHTRTHKHASAHMHTHKYTDKHKQTNRLYIFILWLTYEPELQVNRDAPLIHYNVQTNILNKLYSRKDTHIHIKWFYVNSGENKSF